MKSYYNKEHIKLMHLQLIENLDTKNLLMIKLLNDTNFTYINDKKEIKEFIKQFNDGTVKFIKLGK